MSPQIGMSKIISTNPFFSHESAGTAFNKEKIRGKMAFQGLTVPFLLVGTGHTSFRRFLLLPFPWLPKSCRWIWRNHKKLRSDLESGISLGLHDGFLFNGLGPYQFDSRDGIPHLIINV